jgi:hypothetical protein
MIRGVLMTLALGGLAGSCQTVETKKPAAAVVNPPPAPSKAKVKVKKVKSKPAPEKPKVAAAPSVPDSIKAPELPAKLEPETEAEKKLDGNLLQIVRAGRTGKASGAEAKAKSLHLTDSANLVKVEITAVDKEKVEAVKKAVEAEKGNIVVGLENHVFAMVPPASVEALAKLTEVFSMAVVSDTLRQ